MLQIVVTFKYGSYGPVFDIHTSFGVRNNNRPVESNQKYKRNYWAILIIIIRQDIFQPVYRGVVRCMKKLYSSAND